MESSRCVVVASSADCLLFLVGGGELDGSSRVIMYISVETRKVSYMMMMMMIIIIILNRLLDEGGVLFFNE